MALTAKQAKRWMWGLGLAIAAAAIASAFFLGEKTPHYVQGNVEVAPDLVGKADASTLFIVVYADDAEPGMPPFGAYRFVLRSRNRQGTLHHFRLTDENMQKMPGSSVNPHPAFFRIKARLDRDGAGGADTAGDLVGEVRHVPYQNSDDVKVVLSRVVE